MPKFQIEYQRSSYFDIEIEANNESEAIEFVNRSITDNPNELFVERDQTVKLVQIQKIEG